MLLDRQPYLSLSSALCTQKNEMLSQQLHSWAMAALHFLGVMCRRGALEPNLWLHFVRQSLFIGACFEGVYIMSAALMPLRGVECHSLPCVCLSAHSKEWLSLGIRPEALHPSDDVRRENTLEALGLSSHVASGYYQASAPPSVTMCGGGTDSTSRWGLRGA